jgi:hypothetical protein
MGWPQQGAVAHPPVICPPNAPASTAWQASTVAGICTAGNNVLVVYARCSSAVANLGLHCLRLVFRHRRECSTARALIVLCVQRDNVQVGHDCSHAND